jgi:hypothetical protein
VSATVTEARLVADEHLAGAEGVSVGQRVGGWMIHFSAVVSTSSPSMTLRLSAVPAPKRRDHLDLSTHRATQRGNRRHRLPAGLPQFRA